MAQLQLLARLHDAGSLTDDEFESEKQRILRGS
ncbi:MAG TPA: SHOCT domain-containing protein [Ktedonobacteraceae bacterium]|nr:SHOCT domain-containing protein [Ktedonobacteraceae bacterium]